MVVQRNTELDYILVNLLNNQTKNDSKPDIKQAFYHRDMHSNSIDNNLTYKDVFKNKIFVHLGPGVALYFALIKALFLVFILMSLVSLPAMISNWKGNGLAVYNQKLHPKDVFQTNSQSSSTTINGKKLSDSLMALSLANQPMHQYQNINFSEESTLSQIRYNQSVLTLTDLVNSLIFIIFVLWFQNYSGNLVSEINYTRPLPSYYTLLISGLQNVPAGGYSEQSLANHFSKYGQVAQIGTVYDHGQLLIQVKEFMRLANKFRDAETRQQFQKYYEKLKIKYQHIKLMRPSMTPLKAYVTFESVQTRNRVSGLYQYSINPDSLEYQYSTIDVKKTHTEPVNIIWENFHLSDSKTRSIIVCVIIILITVLGVVGLYLVKTHALTSQVYEKYAFDQALIGNNKFQKYTYEQAADTQDPAIIYSFCSQLSYKDFQWKYYSLCEDYFASFRQPIFSIILFSVITFSINFIVYRIIYHLADVKRHKTKSDRQKFLIMSIFSIYFVNNALLILLIKGKLWGMSFHDLIRDFGVDPVSQAHYVQTYDQFNRKWYMDSGRQIVFNFIVSGILTPWFFVLYQMFFSKWRSLMARRQRSQKSMNEAIKNEDFDFEYFYALALNSVFFAFLYSTAMPILYPLAALSCISIFICSFVIFKHFSLKPQMTDHSLNKIICRFLLAAVFIHQIMSILFVSVDDIFYINYGHKQGNGPLSSENQARLSNIREHSSFLTKLQNGAAFFMILVLSFIMIMFYPKIFEIFELLKNKKHSLFHPTTDTPQMNFSQCYPQRAILKDKKKNQNRSQLYAVKSTPYQKDLEYGNYLNNGAQSKQYPILSSYKIEQNSAYTQMMYTLTVLNMFSRNQIQLSDQSVIKIKRYFDDLDLDGIFQQRAVYSQVGQYELRQKYEFLNEQQGQKQQLS